ncbi:MAG: hypothetical protein H6807_13315 [Planctomycetes bacterium]|nr:hypothetical protein [Planctomycetota bacterium]
MNERDPQEELDAYLDGELSEAEREALDDELEQSQDLRGDLDRLRRTSGSLRAHFAEASEALVDERGEAIAVERIVRMSTQELRRDQVVRPRRRPSPLMIAAVIVVLAGLAILVLAPILDDEPDPGRLVDGTMKSLERQALEFELSLGGLLHRLPLALAGQSAADLSRGTLRLGPDGLFHLVLGQGEDGALVEAGRDSRGLWLAAGPTEPIRRLRGIESETGLFRGVLGFGDRFRDLLEEARRRPEAVQLVGQVKDELSRPLWKVRLLDVAGGHGGELWFDDSGRLAKVSMAGIVARVNHEAGLGRADFELDHIHPDRTIEDEER